MPRYRSGLPQLGRELFLTDGGIETTLIFHDGLELPDFAAFDLLRRDGGEASLQKYFRSYAALAKRFNSGLILESATWRANPEWAARIGYSDEELRAANRHAIDILELLRTEFDDDRVRVVISGCVGPRGDGYNPERLMSADEATDYHTEQVSTFAETSADMVTAITMNYTEEAIGVARAAKGMGIPAAISFTVETDGNLATGQPLGDAIREVDAATAAYPAYYMINCAHPTHFDRVLTSGERWTWRLRGLRANASRKSHAELNESPTLDEGNPVEFGAQHAALKKRHAQLTVFGGCCGTDHRHVGEIASACASLFSGSP